MICPLCGTGAIARTTEIDVGHCLYCAKFTPAIDPATDIDFADFSFKGDKCGYTGPINGHYAAILDFIKRAKQLINFAAPTIDIGGGSGAYKEFFPTPRDIIDFPETPVENGVIHALSNHYGCVLSFETLEHIDDPILCFKEMVRVAKVGAPILITTPVAWGYHPSPGDFWRLQPDAFKWLAQVSHIDIIALEQLWICDGTVPQFFLGRKGPQCGP